MTVSADLTNRDIQASRAPGALAGALLLLVLYAAFSHGAVGSAAEARLQVAVAAVATLAGGAWLWSGTLRVAALRLAYIGTALLAAFAIWSGISLIWSVAPDQTWLELNRGLTYVIVLCLAIAVGASHGRAVELIAEGFLLIVLAVTAYGLGQKLLPGVHVGGIFDLNQTGPLPRLQEPFGYWNALALFIAMAVPIALALAVDRRRTRRTRLGASVALLLMLIAIGLTYSRGALLALAIALAVGIAVSGARLRSLMWLAASCLAATPPLVFGLNNHSLTSAGTSLGDREAAGALLAGVSLFSLLALVAGGRKLVQLEERLPGGPERARRIGRALLSSAAGLLVVGLLAVTFSSRGLDGTVSHAWSSFTSTRSTSPSDPHRLLSADSENRWVWWKEAAGAFSDRPATGWGAGSFPVVHLLYRRDNLSVKQPHSVPLQWLAETGAIGTGFALAAFALLLVTAVRRVRETAVGPGRLLAAALLSGVIVYAVHSLYDWDWDIPGVTLPAIVLLGVLSGSRLEASSHRLPACGRAMRAVILGALTLYLATFAVSAALPSIAATKADAALVTAESGTADALAQAQASAALAGSLDPLSNAGPRAEATIALRRGQPRVARASLMDAVHRDPSDARAWQALAGVELLLGDAQATNRAAERVLALDPRGKLSGFFGLEQTNLLQVPPSDSATATPVPLSPAASQP